MAEDSTQNVMLVSLYSYGAFSMVDSRAES